MAKRSDALDRAALGGCRQTDQSAATGRTKGACCAFLVRSTSDHADVLAGLEFKQFGEQAPFD